MVSQLLNELRAEGFSVTSDGLELSIAGPVEKMNQRRREQIATNRDAIIALVVDVMPDRAELFRRCQAAVVGTGIDPSELTQWLMAQADPGWCVPKAIRRWAEIISKRGGFPE